jgi:hypothetical protein
MLREYPAEEAKARQAVEGYDEWRWLDDRGSVDGLIDRYS